MIEVYKLLTGKEKVDHKQFFTSADMPYDLRGHKKKLAKSRSRLDSRKFFFSQRVVNRWNGLPAKVVNTESVNSFKNAYDRYCCEDMDDRSWSAAGPSTSTSKNNIVEKRVICWTFNNSTARVHKEQVRSVYVINHSPLSSTEESWKENNYDKYIPSHSKMYAFILYLHGNKLV